MTTSPTLVEHRPRPETASPSRSGLLRIITCGSVDDGKSTLIGRMLFDSKSVHEDHLSAVERTSLARGLSQTDLALLTDGLRAEREQGITIDVAYRYFSTPRRKFILADTPGHVQYTRNMVTGASTADAALILIDARKGVIEQTRRHACLAVLLGVRHLIVCINKMDLIGFDRARYKDIVAAFSAFAAAPMADGRGSIAARSSMTFIPMSALGGENVVTPSPHTLWHAAPPLLELLETLADSADQSASDSTPARLPVQYVLRPQSADHHDYRGYAGKIASGALRVGDAVLALPGGQSSRIKSINIGSRQVSDARAPQSVALQLEDDLDIARGDLVVVDPNDPAHPNPATAPTVSRDLTATVIWMAQHPLASGQRFLIKHTTRTIPAVIRSIDHRLNIQSLALEHPVSTLELNQIGQVTLRLATPIAFDPYALCRATGAFIIIDEQTNNTVGGGLIR